MQERDVDKIATEFQFMEDDADHDTVANALNFLRLLPDSEYQPNAMVLDSGNAGLFWQYGTFYADLEFHPDGLLTYFVEAGKEKSKGHTMVGDALAMPDLLVKTLATKPTAPPP